ncbi:MAG: mannosyltransferase family protein [Candidatus Daviesbacteria bacterium]|nr:mannosyltransferase family protein [Candidatus Daviesbacteria bacterium]
MIKKITVLFLTWRIGLFVVAALAVKFIPVFGNRFPYFNQVLAVTGLPSWVWGFGNFDGVHYLRIAQNGYNAEYSQAFFPLYPLLVHFFTNLNLLVHKNPILDTRIYVDPSYFFTGFILSNIFFLLALIFFYKLVRIDFSQKVAFGALILLVSFPTSFYFGSIYTESLFLFLSLGAIYFARKGNFLAAGVFTMFASATRIFGLLLIPLILNEIYIRLKKEGLSLRSGELTKAIIGVLLTPFGSLLYMLYLKLNFDNPLYFLTSQPLFGAERTSGGFILLPQVIYRYLKIFMTVPISSQLFFNAFLEFSFTIVALVCLLLFVKKMRISYFIFTLGCLIMPTLTGTLSSMPRYSLMGFLLLPFIVQSTKGYYKLVAGLFIIIGIILTSLFIRGYWVA